MGWSGGTSIMLVIIDSLMKACPSIALRQRFYRKVIDAFQDGDWDCEGECLNYDPAYDAALKAIWKKQGVDVED